MQVYKIKIFDNIFWIIYAWILLTANFNLYFSQGQVREFTKISRSEQKNHNVEIGQYDLKILETSFTSKLKHFQLDLITVGALSKIFDSPQNSKLKFIVIDTYQNMKETYTFNNEIDIAIMSRPWIIIKKFVYKLNSEHSVMLHNIIFEKLHGKVEKGLKIIGENNYPTNHTECSNRPLYIVDVNGDTWGNRAYNIGGRCQRSKWVRSFFINVPKSPYNALNECTNKINKYECLFLPSTNCELPDSFDRSSKSEQYFTKADHDGVKINVSSHEYESKELKTMKHFEVDNDMYVNTLQMHSIKSKHHYLLTNTTAHITNETTIIENVQLDGSIAGMKHIFGHVYRPNTEFRIKIQHYVDKFRASTHPAFMSDASCVFSHMRKDDRSLVHVEMTKWCLNHTRKNILGNGYERYGKRDNFPGGQNDELSFGAWMNMGCAMAIPYGAYSLEHMINASRIVAPNTRNIFLATDDEEWLKEAMAEYIQQPDNLISRYKLNIYPFHPRRGHRQIGSSDVAAEFFATIEIGQQCDAFTGHKACSAVAKTFYQAMCYSHKFGYLQCPPVYDICRTHI